jgi:hypothetical protein
MNKRRIKCEYDGCDRSYCSYFNLKRHIESSHMGLRKFKCGTCGRFLSSKQNFVDHQNIHTGAKPYACEFLGCTLRFRQLSQYYLHKQLHSEVTMQALKSNFVSDNVLALLGNRLSEKLADDYIIPTLPYSLDTSQLPIILKSQDFQVPYHPMLAERQFQ